MSLPKAFCPIMAFSIVLMGLCPAQQAEPPKSILRSKIDPAHAYVAPSGPLTQVIYGDDDRIDTYLETDPQRLALSGPVCALVSTSRLVGQGNGSFTLQTFAWTVGGRPACAEEPFGSQPVSAFCTGFLVAPDIIATAGHCYDSSDFADVRFVFGFRMLNSQTAATTFAANQVYSGVELLGRELDSTGADYALIRLDRPVTAPGARPLAIRRAGSVAQ